MRNRFIDSESRGTTLSLLYDTNTRARSGTTSASYDGAARRPTTPRDTRSRNEAFIKAKWRSKLPGENKSVSHVPKSAENTRVPFPRRIERKSKSRRDQSSIDFFRISVSLGKRGKREKTVSKQRRAALDVNWARREYASVVGITPGRCPNDLRASRPAEVNYVGLKSQ